MDDDKSPNEQQGLSPSQDANQQLPQPEQQPQPQVLTQPISPVATPVATAKKSKTGLIVGIAIGVASLIIIAIVLVFFLWWQNPKKMVADAVFGALVAEQLSTEGQATLNYQQTQVDVKFSGHKHKNDYAGVVTIKVKPDGIDKEFELKVNGVLDNNGTIYFKADDLDKVVNSAIDAYVDSLYGDSYGYSYYMDANATKQEIRTRIDPLVQEINNQWVKIDTKTINDDDNQETKCVSEAFDQFRKDPQQIRELVSLYKEHEFLIINNQRSGNNGSTGFEIDLRSQQAREKMKSFGQAFETSTLGKRLAECTDGSSSSDSQSSEDLFDENDEASLVIWVNTWTHSLTRVDLNLRDHDEDISLKLGQNFKIGNSPAVDTPSSAKDFEEIYKDWLGSFSTSDSYYSDDYLYDYDDYSV